MRPAFSSYLLLLTLFPVQSAWAQSPATPVTPPDASTHQDVQSLTLPAVAKMIDHGHPDEALTALDTLQSQTPAMPGADRLRGKALYALDRFIEADKAFAAAAELDPHDQESLQMRGLTLFRLGKPGDAIPLLEHAHDWTEKTKVDPSYVLALCYLDTRRYDDARHAFASQYAFAPDSAQAYLLAARMLLRREYVPVAQEFATKALELDPNLPLAHGLLGEIALARQHLDEAIAEFEKERIRNPLDGQVYDRLGDAYYRSEDYQRAQQSLQRALLLEPNATGPYILLGRVLLKIQDPVGAKTYLERAVQMDPSNFMSHSLLGQAYRALGRKEEGSKELKIAEQIQQGNEPKLEGVH